MKKNQNKSKSNKSNKSNKGNKSNKNNKNNKSETISLKDGCEIILSRGVKPFLDRVENVDDPSQFEQTSIPHDQFSQTYDTIFTMCIQREPYNYSNQLYLKHSECLTEYYHAEFKPKLKSASQQPGVSFLREWVKRWRCNKWAVDGMQRMFMYLDRFHVPNSEDLLSTSEQGYHLFRKEVFAHYKDIARGCILECIRKERDGEEQDRDLLRESIGVYVELGRKLNKVELQIYKENFHKALVHETREYYRAKSRTMMDDMSCPAYLRKCEECIEAEQGRLASYIDKHSQEGLMTATRDELLKVHERELLNKDTGIDSMLSRTDGPDAKIAREDLARLYRLYSEVSGGTTMISDAIKVHVTKLGMDFIEKSKQSKSQDHELIIALINLHDRFLNIVKEQFEQDAQFQKALKEAFEEFINKEYYVSALLARYANDILKKGTKIDVSNLENTMQHVVMLYGYIRDKDIFERDFQQYLASRLLQDLSQSEQSERSMIGKLRTEAGYHWTSKLEDMFKDIQRSKELTADFNKSFGNDYDVELNVSVCTTGAWPTSSIPPVKKAAEIVPLCDRFTSFYLSKYSGRRLSFQMDKGKADVSVQFNKTTKKILVCSTYQMLILLLFNQKLTWTFKEIYTETGIPVEDCMIHCQSMAHPKIKVLRKAPNSKDCKDTHKFQINPKYANPRARVNIPIINLGKTDAATTVDNMEPILRLRRHQMDAAVVRIMKARKQLKHAELVSEVVKQLSNRFTPKPVDIKKRIANLIELEYLERSQDDRQTYIYKM